jgi:hypothetical protein
MIADRLRYSHAIVTQKGSALATCRRRLESCFDTVRVTQKDTTCGLFATVFTVTQKGSALTSCRRLDERVYIDTVSTCVALPKVLGAVVTVTQKGLPWLLARGLGGVLGPGR